MTKKKSDGGAVATEEPPKKSAAKKKEEAAAKPLTPAERNKKARTCQERVDALEHKLTAAKSNVKELNSQLEQEKARLRETILDIPQGAFGFTDSGEDEGKSSDDEQ